jgi:hypothetical protein
MNRCDYLDPALCWTGCKDTGRGGALSVLGYHAVTRPKSYHLKKGQGMTPPPTGPTRPRSGSAPAASPSWPTPAAPPGIARPLLVTDRGLAACRSRAALDILEAAGLGRASSPRSIRTRPREPRGRAQRPIARAGMTASSPSAAARRSTSARWSPSCPARPGPVWDFEDIGDWWTRADPAGIAPIVAVPTTAGTGLGGGPRRRDHQLGETHTKKIIFHPKILPAVVICDPS